MATIEMDISEYEVMKENKKLLEDSLKNEIREELKPKMDIGTKRKPLKLVDFLYEWSDIHLEGDLTRGDCEQLVSWFQKNKNLLNC